MANLLVIAIDRFNPRFLGCYGNSWIKTPNLDRLAADSLVFDQFHLRIPELNSFYSDLWGIEAGYGQGNFARLRDQGLATICISDDPKIGEFAALANLDEFVQLDAATGEAPAREMDDTHLAYSLEAAWQTLSSQSQGWCAWLHLASLGTHWDAPLEFRNQYADEDEPEPPTDVIPPNQFLTAEEDELIFGFAQAYAGQMTLLDSCLTKIMEEVICRETNPPIVMVMGTRGISLGEHQRLGVCDQALYGELCRPPLMIRFPHAALHAGRSSVLRQPRDILGEFAAHCTSRHDTEGPAEFADVLRQFRNRSRSHVILQGAHHEGAIRTHGWHLRIPPQVVDVVDGTSASELYAKPDDRWEQNNVASRCGKVVEDLLQLYSYRDHSDAGENPADEAACWAPLDESLESTWH